MCLRTTAPSFDSAQPLSLEFRGRDLVCSNSTLFSSPATVRLMNPPLPQPIQMSDRDLRRPFILLVAEVVQFPL